ncbi:MAG: phytoene dehydrogenase [Epsilonproteobacteria bacterium]|nr:MAG: phytoene dehydrogenase [Campylobacterota bacterium]RLA65785.1 MAG: phytoene dehydrogenase [Campylobacterota bacterium]
MAEKYDCLIIGAGMSGLAAGIRLGMYGKKVCILEKHTIPGGLNSYYKRKSHLLDVGLHALTNFAPKGTRSGPLPKIFRQLRIPYDTFKLSPQVKSKIVFPEHELTFTNNIDDLISEVHQNFPHETDGFLKLIEKIKSHNALSLSDSYLSAKEVVGEYIKDSILKEMIFTPPLIYGSAWENDMDFSQFVIMFESLYLEGLSRPFGGVRTILSSLEEKIKKLGIEIRYRSGVKRIITQDNKAVGVELLNGEILKTDKILSSAGLPETMNMVKEETPTYLTGGLSFTESILILKDRPKTFGADSTLIFYNNDKIYKYQKPKTLVDFDSAVVCFPNNFEKDDLNEGVVRITNIANFKKWDDLDRKSYLIEKEKVYQNSLKLIKKLYPGFNHEVIYKDVFTPKTVKRFTGHLGGAVYGSPEKKKDGTTAFKDLYICGTDQGFLGIVGSMLSGISMANLHVLMGNK